MKKTLPNLIRTQDIFMASKDNILSQWISYETPQKILQLHNINNEKFLTDYASGVFDYFMGVIAGELEIGDCPVMHSLLVYLKHRDIRADELFEICSHFRRSMIDFTYDVQLNSKETFDEISYIFDKNFQGVLQHYTDTIFQKEQEIDRHVELLSEYQKALDESAIISKTDSEGRIVYVNDKYVQLSGYSALELIGEKHSIIKHEDMPQYYFDDLWFQLRNAGIFRGTIKNLKKNGDYFYIDVTIVKIRDPYDDSIEYMSIANDVTTLIDARLEAQKASQAKEYFLSNMSHEIRTPLNAILGFVNLLIEQDLSKQHRKYLEIILNSGENLLSIINDILDFSKLRSGEFTIEPKIFSIHDEISHTLELFVASANSKDITITSFIDPKIPKELYADSLRIKQILSNFLSNAIKFTNVGGHIRVEATCQESVLRVSVHDNGIGIAKEDIVSVFSAFTQAQHGGRENLDGTGLGLSICHQLAEHMNGSVKAESTFGEGSIFWLELPVEIHNKACQIFSDLDDIKALKIVFYSENMQSSYKSESFLKYSNIFNLSIDMVNTLNMEYDIAIFLEEDSNQRFKETILKSDKKYIALTSKPNDIYEKYSHITSICFPLYCSKIKTSFDELLYPDSYSPYMKSASMKFEGHILIAEDNEANQELIKILLLKYGLSYDLASNGLEALTLYKKNNYDLILMDEQMPIMDGNEAVKNILKYEIEKGLRHTPISALTANVIKGAKERGLSSGFDSFLGKPIVIKELERIFFNYLKVANGEVEKSINSSNNKDVIEGLDFKILSKELMLNEDEIIMLVDMFVKKMAKQLPELKNAIESKDYKKISLISHSIKGSSGNFRMEFLQENTSIMERMAKEENSKFDYEAIFEKIENILSKIKIS
ncbi:hybrid sensor histidine kinase/response regulator [Candidatus Sulfurimonas baltica]|uniref:histidine kinase n=1 Tax=Candidatus Sulfurimonas baltica TaxID=2740404 RepID=A0A7S7LU38_9BACT|nr:ATP-binding protein [Candidatus Sulfurimonas baltica]QOY51337.1 response regulator [Candidatus Sulfurimonas baltica]